jgi:hypothetical protein
MPGRISSISHQLTALLLGLLIGVAPAICADLDGAALYQQHCSACHDASSVTRAPDPASLRSIDCPGPVVAGGMLFVESGYGSYAGMPGNVLLAFPIDEN